MTFDWPGEKLLTRMWETIERSGVGLFRPMQMRREGKAATDIERQRIIAIAQAEREAEALRSGNFSALGPIVPLLTNSPSPSPSLLDGSTQDVYLPSRLGTAYSATGNALRGAALRELQRAINVEGVILKASSEAAHVADAHVSEKTIHPDWFSRWRSGAEEVTEDDIQLLWARALTGEATTPGTFSLRTLDFLKSVTKVEAELIEKVGPYVSEGFIFRDDIFFEKRGISMSVLLDLQSLGLITGVGGWDLFSLLKPVNAPEEDNDQLYTFGDIGLWIRNLKRELKLNCYGVSPLGRELFSLGHFKGDIEHLRLFAKAAVLGGCHVQIGTINRPSASEITLAPPFENFASPTDVPNLEK